MVSTGRIVYCDKELVTPEEKVGAILSSIGIPLNNDQLKIHPFTPSEGKSTHSVKLVVDIELKRRILTEAKLLHEVEVFKGIFINNDEPKLTRNENYRLRKKARELRISSPGSIIKINKGILTKDGVECDKFDLNNQIFH